MTLRNELTGRLHAADLKRLCPNDTTTQRDTLEALAALTGDADDRVAYNALWILTHLPAAANDWLRTQRTPLTDALLTTRHTGRRRLLLTLLHRIPATAADVRTDYLDFCLGRINSTEPSGIRALCAKEAYGLCRHHTPLLEELRLALELMADGPLTPALRSVLRQLRRKMK